MSTLILSLGCAIGAASVLASYAARIVNRLSAAALIILISSPGLSLLILALISLYEDKWEEASAIAGLAAYWLIPVAAGSRLGVSPKEGLVRVNRYAILFSSPIVIAGLVLSANSALEYRARSLVRLEYLNKSKQEWLEAERRLAACASSLNANLGVIDASANLKQDDRRLLFTVQTFQESWLYEVPATNLSSDYPPEYVDLPNSSGSHTLRYLVKATPKGGIWTDPWGQIAEGMGRDPDSAAACSKATRIYVESYNKTMLRLGAGTMLKPSLTHQSGSAF
jgi:hypothetical protein